MSDGAHRFGARFGRGSAAAPEMPPRVAPPPPPPPPTEPSDTMSSPMPPSPMSSAPVDAAVFTEPIPFEPIVPRVPEPEAAVVADAPGVLGPTGRPMPEIPDPPPWSPTATPG